MLALLFAGRAGGAAAISPQKLAGEIADAQALLVEPHRSRCGLLAQRDTRTGGVKEKADYHGEGTRCPRPDPACAAAIRSVFNKLSMPMTIAKASRSISASISWTKDAVDAGVIARASGLQSGHPRRAISGLEYYPTIRPIRHRDLRAGSQAPGACSHLARTTAFYHRRCDVHAEGKNSRCLLSDNNDPKAMKSLSAFFTDG